MEYLRVLSILTAVALGLGLSSGDAAVDDGSSRELAAFYSAADGWIPLSRCDAGIGDCVPSSLRTCMEVEGGCVDRLPWEPPQAR